MNAATSLMQQVIEQSLSDKADVLDILLSKRREFHLIHPATGNKMSLTVALPDFVNWAEGMLIQQSMPYLNPDEREFLISGLLPDDVDVFY